MRKAIILFLSLFPVLLLGQSDFNTAWEDFYSYNNVKDFYKSGNIIYTLTDNAVFSYDIANGELEKLSSVHGLSGESTSAIYYSEQHQKLIIGYQNGLLEIIDNKGRITVANDILRLNISGEKAISHITRYENKLYLSTPFAIVVYDIEKLQFGDTYFIGNNSSMVNIRQTEVFENKLYAVTEDGIFSASVSDPNLIDYHNWEQPSTGLNGNFTAIKAFNGSLYVAKNNELFRLLDGILQFMAAFPDAIKQVKASAGYLAIAINKTAYFFDASMVQQMLVGITSEYDFNLNATYAENGQIYLATSNYGILATTFSNPLLMDEIHPEGPVSNNTFSIAAQQQNLWVVYGGYDGAFTPRGNIAGFSHFDGQQWVNIPFNPNYYARDLVHITLDPNDPAKAYISSWNDGMLYVEDNTIETLFNEQNSSLERLVVSGNPDFYSIRVNGSAFDNQGNLWIANAWVNNKIKKRSANGNWSSVDMGSLQISNALGLTELAIDHNNTIWVGSRRNGAFAYNEAYGQKKALLTEASKGSLPDPNVRALAVDRNNRLWIGTQKGLVVFNPSSIFESSIYDASPVIIDDDGIAKRLLGEQAVNTIAIDGADNKWFGTETGGVLATNPNGDKTLYNFNKDNSPLPSNKILNIKVDNSNGKVYIATDKGIVAFKSGVAPFGEHLGEVYAYPNPVRKEHSTVTIDGRKGTHLPKDTNVKILDAGGKLVYETNVKEGQELKGGKVVWDKTNLAGRKVASGIYIVLLTLPDRSETAIAKIAIIN